MPPGTSSARSSPCSAFPTRPANRPSRWRRPANRFVCGARSVTTRRPDAGSEAYSAAHAGAHDPSTDSNAGAHGDAKSYTKPNPGGSDAQTYPDTHAQTNTHTDTSTGHANYHHPERGAGAPAPGDWA